MISLGRKRDVVLRKSISVSSQGTLQSQVHIALHTTPVFAVSSPGKSLTLKLNRSDYLADAIRRDLDNTEQGSPVAVDSNEDDEEDDESPLPSYHRGTDDTTNTSRPPRKRIFTNRTKTGCQ